MKKPHFKILLAWMLSLGMLLSGLTVQAEETLPNVGPQIGTTAGQTGGEETTTAPTDDPATEGSEEIIVPVATEETTEAEPEPVPEQAGLSAEEFLALRSIQQTDSVQTVGLPLTNGEEAYGSDLEAGLLLARRMRRMAENSEQDIVVFRGNGWLNVRAEADATSALIGKLYYSDTAYVVGRAYTENGIWYHINSGNVDGFIKSEFVLSGYEATEVISETITRYAYIINDAQRVYREADSTTDVLGYAQGGEKYEINWIKDNYFTLIDFAKENDSNVMRGYIPNSSYELVWELPTGITLEEEERSAAQLAQIQAELAYLDSSREESRRVAESIRQSIEASRAAYNAWLQSSIAASSAERARREAAAAASRAQASREAESRAAAAAAAARNLEAMNYGNYTSMIPTGTSSLRRSIVSNALNYVNKLPYVVGGASLSTGADCSGFLQAIYAQYGIRLAHYSYTIARTGTKVVGGIDAARPGDIICYRTWNGGGHVTMFIGWNMQGKPMMVHSPDVGMTVSVSEVYYDGLHTVQNVIGD